MNIIKIVFGSLIMIIFLTGCVAVKSSVTAFHTLPEINKPTKYAFLPTPKQRGSLEHRTYMSYILQELKKYQYTISPISEASVLILFDYTIGDGKVHTSSVPTYGQTGVSSSTTYGTVSSYGNYGTYSGTTTYRPKYGITGSKTVSSELYTRKIVLLMLDKKTKKHLYEATVISEGSSNQIGPVMHPMIRALFKEFPGESGDTRKEIMSR